MTNESLADKVERLDRTGRELTIAVERSASRRTALGLGIAIGAIFALMVAALVNAGIQRHGDCVRGNEVRVAILTSTTISTDTLISAFVQVSTVGRTPEQAARAAEAGERLRKIIDEDPGLRAAHEQLGPRPCSYWPW